MLIDSWMLGEESEPPTSGSVGVVRIHRGGEFYMSASRFHVYIDDKLAGKILWKQSVDCSVNAGTHTIYVAIQAMRGDVHQITVEAGQLVELQIESLLTGLERFTKSLFKPSEVWFRLVQKSTGDSLGAAPAAPIPVKKEEAAEPAPMPETKVAKGSTALDTWREKLEFFLKEEALATDAEQKFAIGKKIEEARRKIDELGG